MQSAHIEGSGFESWDSLRMCDQKSWPNSTADEPLCLTFLIFSRSKAEVIRGHQLSCKL